MSDLQNTLFYAMTDGVLVLDENGVIVDCNPMFHQNLGYDKEELIGASIASFDVPQFTDGFSAQFSRGSGLDEATFETAYRCKDGSVVMAELSVRSIAIESWILYLCIVRDITQRHRLEVELKESLEVYRAAINTPALGFWMVDAQGRFLEVNDAYVTQSGYGRKEILGMDITDIEAEEGPEETSARIDQIIKAGYGRFRSKHRRKDGMVWPVEVVTTYSPVQGGRFFVFIEDITEKITQENQLELASRVFETMEQAVVITDADNRIVSINPAAVRITGYDLSDLLGEDPRIFASGRHDKSFYADMWHSLNSSGQWEGEIWDRRKDGSVYVKWLTINIVYDRHGKVFQYVSVFSDITERKKNEELVWRQANFDSLTRLPNRYLLYDHLKQEIRKAQRGGWQLAVLFIDLDRFKEVNDTLGHTKGDALLIQVARRISHCVRETDIIARFGGDEFTVVLSDFGGQVNLERIVQALIQDLSKPYDLGGDELAHVTASIGITIYPDDSDNLEELIKHSDRAMYVAKAVGRNRFCYFTRSMQRDAHEKIELTTELHRAVLDDRLSVFYQPIVELTSGNLVMAEALLRWNHPERGMIEPLAFIPLAEEAGLIHEIGNWTFHQVISGIERWRELYGCSIQVSINKSALQFEGSVEPNWFDRLNRLGLQGKSITVEITESALLSGSQRIRQRLLEFRDSGIEISIDDFGTGFSSLSCLHQFDIDYLKIDRGFIAELEMDASKTTLIEAIVAMAHKLGIRTIAEGVESVRQRDLLLDIGCDYAQGYFYAKPLPQDDFERLLATGKNIGL